MAIATLTIDMVAKLGELETGLNKATQLAERNAAKMEGAFKSVSGALGGLAAAFSAGALAAGLQRIVDGLDRFNDVKDATGASIANLSALEDVVVRAGGSFDDATATLIRFNKVLADAQPGSEFARILGSIGLSVEDLRRADPVEALQRTAQALAKYADTGAKARAVQELFGKSVQQAAPILNDLAEAGKLNATVTAEQAKAAEDFNKAFSALRKTGQDVGRDLAGDIVPGLTALAKALNDSTAAAQVFNGASSALRTVFEAVTVLGANVAFVLTGIGRELAAVFAQAEALTRLDFAAYRAIGEAVKEDGRLAAAALNEFERRVLGLDAAVKPAIESTNKLAGALDGAGAAAKRSAKELSLFRSANEGFAGDAEGRTTIAARLAADLERLREVTGQAATAKLFDTLELLNRAYFEGLKLPDGSRFFISDETFDATNARLLGLRDGVDEISKATERAGEAGDKFALTFASSIGRLIDTGGKIEDVFKALLQDISKLVIQLTIVEPLARRLRDAFNGTGGSGGSWVTQLLNLIGSGASSGAGVSGGGGGAVGASNAGATMRAKAAGAVVVNYYNTIEQVGSDVSRAEVLQAMNQSSDIAVVKIQDAVARGRIALQG